MAKEDTLVIHEIYASIQGESTFAGLPCTFVRTTGCNLRCVWCDTPQAFYGGTRLTRAEVLSRALATGTQLVELTGGEPLLQPGVLPLMRELCDAGRTVLVETSGAEPMRLTTSALINAAGLAASNVADAIAGLDPSFIPRTRCCCIRSISWAARTSRRWRSSPPWA